MTVSLIPERLAHRTVVVIGEAVRAREGTTAAVVLVNVVHFELELLDEVLVGDVRQDGVDEAIL